ncbi:MAG: hypothetical protein ACFB9N_06995 [Geitlerinemataceae cyanobacterium]
MTEPQFERDAPETVEIAPVLEAPQEPDDAPLAPAKVRLTEPIGAALDLTNRPLWQVAVGLGGGAIVLTLVVIEAIAASGLAIQALGRAIVAIVTGAMTLVLFAALPLGSVAVAQRWLNAKRGPNLRYLRVAIAIAIISGITIGILIRLLFAPPS